MIFWLVVILLALLLTALSARVAAGRAEGRTGLPAGKLLYSDTGFPVGEVGTIEVDERGARQERPLRSLRFGLVGRPDYLVRVREGVVPVEAKSARCPPDGRPRDSHVMQLTVYCLLAEDVLGARVPYGIIRYSDREVRVEYTNELREELLALVGEMREARAAEEVHRSHDEARRCANCSMREICDEALA